METKTKNGNKGRKKLDSKSKRSRVYIYLNNSEINDLKTRIANSSSESLSEYIRSELFRYNQTAKHINPVAFLNEVSSLAFQVGKIGNNINQLAKYSNQLSKTGMIQPELFSALNEQLQVYIELQKQIQHQMKGVIKK